MRELRAGFARLDITPPLGIPIAGYYELRPADGILDPLYASAVVFDDGVKRGALLNVDMIGVDQHHVDQIREAVAQRIGTEAQGIFVECSHTHTGPVCSTQAAGYSQGNQERIKSYFIWLISRLCDAAALAVQDLTPTKMLHTCGKAEKVAFIRRYRMQDGSILTNPGALSPFVKEPVGEADERVQLLILRRENAPEIGIVNFQVHPDVIGGCKISADYPKFVRDTYEKLIENSCCVYINGAQGDTNHNDVSLYGTDKCIRGYERARYMGRKIAMAAVSNYELAEPLKEGNVSWGQKNIVVSYNKGLPEEYPLAAEMAKVYAQSGQEEGIRQISRIKGIEEYVAGKTELRRLLRINSLANMPDEKELHLTALAVGPVVFAGFPGEPFTWVGLEVKKRSRFPLTVTACCANGYEGYYPVWSAYEEGGYEAAVAKYRIGTAEAITEAFVDMINQMAGE